jgi:hypothetical protein
MWSSWVKEKGTTQVMYITKVKNGPKRVKKTLSMILKRVFEMVWWRGEMESHQKEFLKLKCFLLSKYWLSLLFEETLGAFFFLFFSCSVSWGLGGFDDIWGENYFKNFFLNGFKILAVDTYSEMELCTPIWRNQDYGDRRVVDILVMDAYSGVEVYTTIFLGEASN